MEWKIIMIKHKKRKKVVNITALVIVTILVFATFFSLNTASSFGLSLIPLPLKQFMGRLPIVTVA
jgi:hypothetical protein